MLSRRSPTCRKRPTPPSSPCRAKRTIEILRQLDARGRRRRDLLRRRLCRGGRRGRRAAAAADRRGGRSRRGRTQLLRPAQLSRRHLPVADRALAASGSRRGCAFVGQSGNIALNVTPQRPLGAVRLCHQLRQPGDPRASPTIVDALADDPKVTAIGLYIEGINDVPAFSRAARQGAASAASRWWR